MTTFNCHDHLLPRTLPMRELSQPSGEISSQLKDVLRLSLKDGDLLFVDTNAIDLMALCKVDIDVKVIVVPVFVEPGSGKTIADYIQVVEKPSK